MIYKRPTALFHAIPYGQATPEWENPRKIANFTSVVGSIARETTKISHHPFLVMRMFPQFCLHAGITSFKNIQQKTE